jgi:hypothetical protein
MNRLNLSVLPTAPKSRDLRDSSSSSGSAANSPQVSHTKKSVDIEYVLPYMAICAATDRNSADEEMMNMEVVKTMFAKLRTSKSVSKSALAPAALEDLAKYV